jgi:uncharacterized delta-60 repeat protein
MKVKLFLLNKTKHTLPALILIAALLVSTNALAAEGALDPTFGTDGIVVTDLGGPSDGATNIALQPDGKIIMAGSGNTIARYNLDGTLDTTFGTGGQLTAVTSGPVALQPDGKLIVGGTIDNGLALARYTSSGILDTTFGTNGVVSVWENPNSLHVIRFGDLVVQPDGKVWVVGIQDITDGNHVYCLVARFDENGALDGGNFFDEQNFPESERNYCRAVALQSDGKVILSGHAEPNFSGMAIILGRLPAGSDFQFDDTFGTNGHGTVVTPITRFTHGRGAIAIQSDDKIVIAGTKLVSYSNPSGDLVLARYNSDGTLDTTFDGSGIVITDFGQDEAGNDVAVQRDGKILVAGKSSSNLLLVRYNSDGSLDTSFGDEGKVITTLGGSSASAAGIALQPDGKILAAGGKDGDALLARYEGTLPPLTTITFNSKAASDGWLLESTESSNVGGTLNKTATTFYVGDDPKDKQYRAIISFNTASLPDNAFLVSAQVKVKRQGIVGTDPFTTHGNLLLDIRNGLFSNNLDLKVSDFAAAASSITPDTITPLTSSWYAANLSSSNLPFVNKYGVTQFRLRFDGDDNDDLGADYMKFFTGESTTANQPQLIVVYVLP